jgi:hypothetical protein
MDLITRYVCEVGRHLPKKVRADVETELHSLLTESLEERAREAGRTADRAMVVALLREFGEPEEVSERYLPPAPSLVGPHMYPVFKLVMTIVLAIIGGIFAIKMAFAAYQLPLEEWLQRAGESGASAMNNALMNLGFVVLIFAIIERIAGWRAKQHPEEKKTVWDPEKLPELQPPDRMKAGDHVFAIYAVVVFAVVFNFYPEWVGVIFRRDGEWSVFSLLRPEFQQYMMLLNVWWASVFSLNLFVLREGRWTPQTRWAELGIGIAGMAITALIILGDPVFYYDRIIKAILKVALVIAGIENTVRFFRALRSHSLPPRGLSAGAGRT